MPPHKLRFIKTFHGRHFWYMDGYPTTTSTASLIPDIPLTYLTNPTILIQQNHRSLHSPSHPFTFKCVLKSQFIRYKRICSTEKDYDIYTVHSAPWFLGPTRESHQARHLEYTSQPQYRGLHQQINYPHCPPRDTKLTAKVVTTWIKILETHTPPP